MEIEIGNKVKVVYSCIDYCKDGFIGFVTNIDNGAYQICESKDCDHNVKRTSQSCWWQIAEGLEIIPE